MCMRIPAKQAAGTEVTFCGVQAEPSAPSPAKPWSSVTWFAGIDPLGPALGWFTKSMFQGAFVARRLYSPVPSWKLDRLNAARITVLPPQGFHARPMRGRKFAMPLYWLYRARLLPF